MTILLIDGVEYEAKFNFKFSKVAEEKYGETDEKGNKSGGFHSVYMGLLQGSNESLVAFWDCGLSYLKGKDKPSLEAIQDAIVARIDEDEDTEPMLKEAYQAIDQSGFFKQQSKKFWKNIELMKSTGKTDEEKERNLKVYDMLVEAKKELTA
ncbi:tail assembly chaperone [Peribacillus sp. JNUCC 23]